MMSITLSRISQGILSAKIYGLEFRSSILICLHKITHFVFVWLSSEMCKGNLLSVFVIGHITVNLVCV